MAPSSPCRAEISLPIARVVIFVRLSSEWYGLVANSNSLAVNRFKVWELWVVGFIYESVALNILIPTSGLNNYYFFCKLRLNNMCEPKWFIIDRGKIVVIPK